MLELFCSMLLCILLMVVPGTLILRALRFSWVASLCASPLVTIPGYCITTIALSKAGITASTLVVTGPMLAFGAIALAASLALRKFKASAQTDSAPAESSVRIDLLPSDSKKNWLLAAFYLLSGLAATSYIFLTAVGQPDGIIQAWDNAFHYGQIRSFWESGVWSPLYSSRYLAPAAAAFDPFPSAGYYPAAWHIMAVMLCDTLGVTVGIAANASTAAFICFGLPAGMFLLAHCIFGERTAAIALCGISCVSFSAFPWAFLYAWTATPNLISTCLVPGLIALFMAAISKNASRRARVLLAIVFVIGVLCMAFTQPNSVFTAAVFLTPYVFWRIWTEVCLRYEKSPKRAKWLALSCGGWLLFVAIIWVGLFKAPFLRSLVMYDWGQFLSWDRAITGVLTLSFVEWDEQILLALLVYAGIAYSFKHREFLWLSVAYLMAAIMCVLADAGSGTIKHLLTGFWYTDPYRMAAVVALFGMPLAALGAFGIYRLANTLLSKQTIIDQRPAAQTALAAGVALLFVVLVFAPPSTQKMGSDVMDDTLFGRTRYRLWSETNMGSGNGKIQYDTKKREFVKRVMETVPADAVIINQPYDGSIWAYGLDGINVVNRYMGGYGDDGERLENKTIRRHADIYNRNRISRDALADTKAAYLLHLDHERLNMEKTPNRPYVPSHWTGIDSVTDETPGYEIVLKDNNMRLYKITYPELAEN